MTEFEYIRNRIREHMNATADHMASGGCETFEQYQYCAGMVKAFAVVEREIIDLEDKLKQD